MLNFAWLPVILCFSQYITPGSSVLGGNYTKLDEFPFMAVLLYQHKNDSSPESGQTRTFCSGTLINPTTVLTAAICVRGKHLRKNGKLVAVRLGDYDLTKSKDCVDGECADPVLDVGIDEKIRHEKYDVKSANQHHNIALIRLDRTISFTKYIKPVALPESNFPPVPPGTNLTLVGWGQTANGVQNPIKLKVDLPLRDHSKCTQVIEKEGFNFISSQLCAGGEYEKDSSTGDAGAPLLKGGPTGWVIVGIVSYGSGNGYEGVPGVYTNVSSYRDWIDKNIE